MRRKFSKSWNASKQPRKQRKFRFNAPAHIRQKFMGCHLSKELRKKYGKRSITVRKGDKVRVAVGQYHGKTGKVDRMEVKKQAVYISGIDFTKKEGSKVMIKFHPSNLIITDLNLEDKKRIKKLEGAKKPVKDNKETKESKK